MLEDSDAFRQMKFLWEKWFYFVTTIFQVLPNIGKRNRFIKILICVWRAFHIPAPAQGQLMIMLVELNNEMRRKRYAVNNAGSNARGQNFSEICGEKRG